MIDSKWLKGLVWSGAHDRGVKDVDGRKIRVYESYSRPLEQKDVLSFKEVPDGMIVVTSDGKKHHVLKPLASSAKVETLKVEAIK